MAYKMYGNPVRIKEEGFVIMQSMKIQDIVYGTIEITEQAIIDLIHSQPIERLKHISQDGASHYLQPFRTVTRFEHSIGTWFLSKKYNRSLPEQIASLLHDIPHTAFSHVADFVMKDENHEYHDRFFEKIILQSDIPDILKKHKIKVEEVLAKEKYPLLDNKLPDISVDRWDYFLRDASVFGIAPKEVLQVLFSNLKEENEMFYFENLSTATLAAILFMNCSRLIWLDPTSHGAFFLLSEAIKTAMDTDLLVEEDLFGTDKEVMRKMKTSKNEKILGLLDRLYSGKQFSYAAKETAEFFGPNKPRYIDPFVKTEEGLKRISKLVPGMHDYFQEYIRNYKYLGVIQEK